MTNNSFHDFKTSNVSWSQHGAPMQHATDDEVVTEADEPPDAALYFSKPHNQFRRSVVRKPSDNNHESLLTKALHHPNDEASSHGSYETVRRRSMTSNISAASTVDLISDASGVTSPARSNTPSPPPPVIAFDCLNANLFSSTAKVTLSSGPSATTAAAAEKRDAKFSSNSKATTADSLPKKRCISFACGGTQAASQPGLTAHRSPPVQQTSEDKAVRKPRIKFAGPSQIDARAPSPKAGPSFAPPPKSPRSPGIARVPTSPSIRKQRSSSTSRPRSQRSSTPRPAPHSPRTPRSKQYLQAGPEDLNREFSRFHEFASDEPQEDDWIRDHYKLTGKRITVNDTLVKELRFRRLGKEVEEEEEEEEGLEAEDDAAANNSEDEDDENDEDEDEDEENEDEEDEEQDDNLEDSYDAIDDVSVYGSGDDVSDGYHTDNEVGFADSDDEDDGEDFQLWTLGQAPSLCIPNDRSVSRQRRPSLAANCIDSTSSSDVEKTQKKQSAMRRIKIRPGTPELPDSTDFVCGTLDEDRALEDAYISCVAARRREKLHVIPQDIDPSFPTSEPDDDEDDEPQQSTAHDSDDHLWIHGNMEDINHDKGNPRDRRSKPAASPRRHRSPPPKRARSPAPQRVRSPPPKMKLGGRSPKCLFGRQSPRQLLSPPLNTGNTVRSPPASLVQGGLYLQGGMNTLAFRPGPTQTKSLPRAAALFPPHLKAHRRAKHAHTSHKGHMRGAIDIVKGLEQKRQRRKEKEREKYVQKHCNMARKGQIHEKRPVPGKGAERMREIGLLMATNKRAPAGFVLSV